MKPSSNDVGVPMAASPVKRSPRLAVILLFLIAVGTVIRCRSAIGSRSLQDAQPIRQSPWNDTLLDIAAAEAADPDGLPEVEEFLTDNPAGDRPTLTPLKLLHKLYGRCLDDAKMRTIRIRAARWIRFLPDFHRAFHQWFRQRGADPDVMLSLPSLVKGPLDVHRGASPSAARFATCAVVGNSGILLDGRHGPLIDGHELVIRLNNARVYGFEAHVGTKTDLSFVNSNILYLCGRRPNCACHPYGEHVPMIMYICQAMHFLDYVVCNTSRKAPLLVTDPRLDSLCAKIVKYYSLKRFAEESGREPSRWGEAHDAKMFHYSSGMQAVVLAAGLCERVSLFGFGKAPGAKHHYHTNQKSELDLHDYEAEYAFYSDLMNRPKDVPFIGDSGFRVPPVVMYR